MNKVVIMGRLVADPIVRNTANNIPVASIRIAVNRRYAKQGEERQTDFFNCIAWSASAQFLQKYFKKGQMIGITGRLETRTYNDQNGTKHNVTEIIIEEIDFTGSKTQQSTGQQTEQVEIDEAIGDDLPF